MAITDFIDASEEIITETIERLNTYDQWTVETFDGTNVAELLSQLGTAKCPAAIVVYTGSRTIEKPKAIRRIMQISVYVVALSGNRSVAAVSARDLIDTVTEKLDDHVDNRSKWVYRGDTAIDAQQGRACYQVDFEVQMT